MAGENELKVKITTSYDSRGVLRARDQFGKFVKLTDDAEKKSRNFSGALKGINLGFDDFRASALGANIGIAGVAGGLIAVTAAAGKGALELAKIGAESITVARTFESISGSAAAATANMLAMDRATRGLVDKTTEQQLASKLMGLEIADNAKELEETAQIAIRLGREFKGLKAPEAIDELALTLANQSIPRLDSFGISASNVKAKMAELQQAGVGVQESFKLAFFEEARKTMEKLPPEMDTTTTSLQRLSAEWSNFTSFLGEGVETAGGAGDFVGTLANGLQQLRVQMGGGDLNDQIAALTENIKDLEAAQQAVAEGGLSGWLSAVQIKIATTLGFVDDIDAMKSDLADLESERAKIEQKGIDKQEAKARLKAAEDRAAERAEQERKFADSRKAIAQKIVDQQRETDNRLKEAAESYQDDIEDAAESHQERLADIQKQGAKRQVSIEKDLQKALAKLDKDSQKELEKASLDEDKSIRKFQEENAKKDKQDKRKSDIDALADERLFQFELRRLSAEGEGIAIKEALERRAIEEEIAREKAGVEQDIQQEKRQDEIQNIRQEAAEKRNQLQQETRDRAQELQDRAAEERQLLAEQMAEQVADEGESYAKRKADLAEYNADRIDKIKQSDADALAEMGRGFGQIEELTNSQLDRLVSLAGEFGEGFGQNLADGIATGFGENFKIKSILDKLDAGSSASNSGGGLLPPVLSSNNGGGMPVFQGGGVMARSGPAMLHQGEEVANPNIGQAIVISGERFAVREAGRMAAAINRAMEHNIQSLVDQIAEAI